MPGLKLGNRSKGHFTALSDVNHSGTEIAAADCCFPGARPRPHKGARTRMNETQMIQKVMLIRARRLLLADPKLNTEECARKLAADFACPYEDAVAQVNKAAAKMCSSARRKGAQA